MKLEFLPDGSSDHPLIRLFHFSPTEAAGLHAAVARLGAGAAERVEVHALEGVEPIANCELTLVVWSWDQALVQKGGVPEFECGFTIITWDNVAGLIEPFTRGCSGFQWLAGAPGEAALLLSVDGHW